MAGEPCLPLRDAAWGSSYNLVVSVGGVVGIKQNWAADRYSRRRWVVSALAYIAMGALGVAILPPHPLLLALAAALFALGLVCIVQAGRSTRDHRYRG